MFPNHGYDQLKETLASANNSISESVNILILVPASSGISDGHELHNRYGECLYLDDDSDDSKCDVLELAVVTPDSKALTYDQQEEGDLNAVCGNFICRSREGGLFE